MTDTFVANATGTKYTITKDPNAQLDYVFDWTTWLDAIPDAIATHSSEVTSNTPGTTASIVQSIVNGKTVVVWVAGGVVGETLALRCRIITTSSPQRIDDRTVYIKIKER